MPSGSVAPGSSRSRLRRLSGLLLVVVLATLAVLFAVRDTIRLGAECYVYGYPLVITDATRQTFAATRAAPNTLFNVPRFPDAGFREIVRPNVDTLYSVAWLDLAEGPRVFEVPATDRYYVIQFLDAWTNVFASVGPRTTGQGPGAFLVVGPLWQGNVPPGVTLLRSPTRIAWLLGRIQTNGASDYAFVHALQGRLRLRSLEDFLAERMPAPPSWSPATREPPPPLYQMRAMAAGEFFTRLARLLVDNPPSAADQPAVEGLQKLGVRPGHPLEHWSWIRRGAVALGIHIAERRMQRAVATPGELHEGWRVPPMAIGDYGTEYGLRAVVAMVGLGANRPADGVYPIAQFDADGKPLAGGSRYVLHFAAGQAPPVRAFWSVTAYDGDGYLIDNALNRYALGDRDPLTWNADGSLDIHLQTEAPAGALRSNWLPIPAHGPFSITARLYWPEDSVLKGAWRMPGIRRVQD
jgi:hypothetical protein